MTPIVTKPPDLRSQERVLQAIDDPGVRECLFNQALSILARRLGYRPIAVRFEAATEAVQETMLRALQKWHDYDSALSERAWLHGIMNNVLFETARTILRMPAQEAADAAGWGRLTEALAQHSVDAVLNRLDVTESMARLSNDHREILELRYSSGLSNEEIASHFGISNQNARVRLCRALNAVRTIAGAVAKEDRP